MPLYFMSIDYDHQSYLADEGIELDDLVQAETEAVAVLLQLTRGRPLDATPRLLSAVVRDEAGHELSKVSLTLAVERPGGPVARPSDPPAPRHR